MGCCASKVSRAPSEHSVALDTLPVRAAAVPAVPAPAGTGPVLLDAPSGASTDNVSGRAKGSKIVPVAPGRPTGHDHVFSYPHGGTNQLPFKRPTEANTTPRPLAASAAERKALQNRVLTMSELIRETGLELAHGASSLGDIVARASVEELRTLLVLAYQNIRVAVEATEILSARVGGKGKQKDDATWIEFRELVLRDMLAVGRKEIREMEFGGENGVKSRLENAEVALEGLVGEINDLRNKNEMPPRWDSRHSMLFK